jgi:hypothetical protein
MALHFFPPNVRTAKVQRLAMQLSGCFDQTS